MVFFLTRILFSHTDYTDYTDFPKPCGAFNLQSEKIIRSIRLIIAKRYVIKDEFLRND